MAAAYADVYLTWGKPPAAVAEKLDRVRERAKATGRELRFGIRLHVIARTRSEQAWAQAQELLDGLDPAAIERPRRSSGPRSPRASAGCRSCTAAGPTRSRSRPTCTPPASAWSAAARAPPWSAAAKKVADRIAEYRELGIDEFILSGYPHLEEAYQVGEGVMPVLRRRGLLAGTP